MIPTISLLEIITSDKIIIRSDMKQHQVTADILESIMNQVIEANQEAPGTGTELFKKATKKAELLRSGAFNEPVD